MKARKLRLLLLPNLIQEIPEAKTTEPSRSWPLPLDLDERCRRIGSVLEQIKAVKRRLEIVIHGMDPRCQLVVLSGESDEVWSDETIRSRMQKRYPFVEWDDISVQWLRLPGRVLVWLYPNAYIELSRTACDERTMVTFSAPAPHMWSRTGAFQIPLSTDACCVVQYDRDGFLRGLNYLAESVKEDSGVNSLLYAHELYQSSAPFLDTKSLQGTEANTFQMGKWTNVLGRIGVIGLVLVIVMVILAVVFRARQHDSAEKIRELDVLQQEVRELGQESEELGIRLREQVEYRKRNISWQLNELLQSRTDDVYFKEADVQWTENGPHIFTSGVAGNAESLTAFLTAAREKGFVRRNLKQRNQGKGIRFEADFSWQ